MAWRGASWQPIRMAPSSQLPDRAELGPSPQQTCDMSPMPQLHTVYPLSLTGKQLAHPAGPKNQASMSPLPLNQTCIQILPKFWFLSFRDTPTTPARRIHMCAELME